MKLIELKVENFRNIENETLYFSPEINLIWGNNAEGKTNIIEAIYYFANSKSFRTVNNRDLIKFGAEEAKLTAIFENDSRKCKYQAEIDKLKKRSFYYNEIKITKMSDFFGNLRAVLFVPEHLKIIKNGPSERRSMLDSALCQLKKVYISELFRYTKLADNKNALLRNYKNSDSENTMLDIYDNDLIKSSIKISQYRKNYAEKLFERAAYHLKEMSGDKMTFSYKVSGASIQESIEDFYEKAIPQSRKRDILYKTLTIGAGRDDIQINVNDKDLKQFGSQGQQRSAVIALKLAEGEIMQEMSKTAPIYLFDDILSELDFTRREYILSRLKGKQVIITSCQGDESGIYSGNRIYVEKGKYK